MMRSALVLLALTGSLSDSTEELLIAVTAVLSGIACLLASLNWYRVGNLRDLMLSRSETRLAVRLDEIEEGFIREQASIKKRLAELENWRSREHKEILDTSDHLVHTMDALREQIQAERSAIIADLRIEFRSIHDEHVRSIAKQEIYKAIEAAEDEVKKDTD